MTPIPGGKMWPELELDRILATGMDREPQAVALPVNTRYRQCESIDVIF
jgi:hypothetical protein